MAGFGVDVGDLRASAKAARAAAEQVDALGLAAVAGLAAALPGTQSGPSAQALGEHWENWQKSWAKAERDYADKLDAAANSYKSRNEAARADFQGSH